MPRRLKVLYSVYACSPKKGSEAGMGWNFIRTLSNFHEVHAITEVKWKQDIDEHFSKDPDLAKRIRIYYLKKKRNYFLRRIWPPSYYYFYREWQKKVYELALELDKKEQFDIMHHLNMVGYREPGYLWKIRKPFVWGPLGGLEDVNFKLLLNTDPAGFIFYCARFAVNQLQKRTVPRLKRAASRDKSFLIASTEDDRKQIKRYWNRDSALIPEVGQELIPADIPLARSNGEPLRIAWSGEHEARKALNILLKGLRHAPPEFRWQLSILGSGRMTQKWKTLACKYGIDENCIWHNWMQKAAAHEIMRRSHVLCITSIKDLTSTVTMEALSFGLPVICIDHCGFGNVVNESCGIKIPVDYPSKVSSGFMNALLTLYSDETYRVKLANGALKRVTDFGWEKKAQEITRIYNLLVSSEQ